MTAVLTVECDSSCSCNNEKKEGRQETVIGSWKRKLGLEEGTGNGSWKRVLEVGKGKWDHKRFCIIMTKCIQSPL